MTRMLLIIGCWCLAGIASAQGVSEGEASQQPTRADEADAMRAIQSDAMADTISSAAHWGINNSIYSSWTNHSNRLVPVYTFGLTFDRLREEGSVYSDPKRLKQLYGRVPEKTVNPTAIYYDQTDIYRLQCDAIAAGFSNIIVMVFDGMDWQTTRAAALYKQGRDNYETGRGTGLAFQDERRISTDFAFVVTSPLMTDAEFDVNGQTVLSAGSESTGGFDPSRGGEYPWHETVDSAYLIGLDRELPHGVTDSASSATSMFGGVKTYNGAINFRADGSKVEPIAHRLQRDEEFMIGVVTSVPVSHATPAAAYAHNVTRKDYQDLSRDMLGLPSSAHRREPLPGVDVLIGGGWGEHSEAEKLQGDNFLPGNPFIHEDDVARSDVRRGGRYVVAERSRGVDGGEHLQRAAQRAADQGDRLLGIFGVDGGHLPFRTADGNFNPAMDMKGIEHYSAADVHENPSLAEMTQAALTVLEQSVDGFWLLVEAGDVDWANHANNLDCSIGAVLSGDEAFRTVMRWIDDNNAWDYTAVIVTADHGHYLVIDQPQQIADAGAAERKRRRGQ